MTTAQGDSARSTSPGYRGWVAFGLAIFVWARLLLLPVEASRLPEVPLEFLDLACIACSVSFGAAAAVRRDRAGGVGLIGACLSLSAYAVLILFM